jgi:hypothetical protein
MITDLFSSTTLESLYKLSRFFVWKRKFLSDSISEALHSADLRYDALTKEHQKTVVRLEVLDQTHVQLKGQLANAIAEFESNKQALLEVQHLLEETEIKRQREQETSTLKFEDLSARHAQLTLVRDKLQETICELEQTLQLTRTELLASNETNTSLYQRLAQQKEAHKELAEHLEALKQRHGDTWTRFQLISRLLAARPQDSAGLAQFRELLDNDYMAFAVAESSLAAEAKALTMLQSIAQELALLVSFPEVRERAIVGIVGGFSSGKSEFINSFIDDPQIRLAVGVQPVTAIPSYVLATDQRSIRGYSVNGGHIELDVDFYKKMSHAFINSFSFDLKSLMPFMCVGVPMKSEYFSNICFIDTPGYNSASTAAEHSQGDRRTAVQFSQQADSLIWLIGLDSTGTVPNSDLEFIRQIGVEDRSVYVVLTKADLRSAEEIEDILDEIQDSLDEEGIQISGISAYSSILRDEVAFRKASLFEYFTLINRRGDIQLHLEKRLAEVFEMYEQAIQADISALLAQKAAINSLHLDCLEVGGQELYDRMRDSLDKLTRSLGMQSLQEESTGDHVGGKRSQAGVKETRVRPDAALLAAWLKESQRLHEAFRGAVQRAITELETGIHSAP